MENHIDFVFDEEIALRASFSTTVNASVNVLVYSVGSLAMVIVFFCALNEEVLESNIETTNHKCDLITRYVIRCVYNETRY